MYCMLYAMFSCYDISCAHCTFTLYLSFLQKHYPQEEIICGLLFRSSVVMLQYQNVTVILN